MEDSSQTLIPVTVEVRVHNLVGLSLLQQDALRDAVYSFLEQGWPMLSSGICFERGGRNPSTATSLSQRRRPGVPQQSQIALPQQIHCIRIETADPGMSVSVYAASLHVFLYDVSDAEPADEGLFSHWELPHASLEGVWESLKFDSAIQQDILDYSASMATFARAGVSSTVVNFSKLILLHGPPGTGKTSLCRGACQKLAIRCCSGSSPHAADDAAAGSSARMTKGDRPEPTTAVSLVEVNAHSLFSKWFSESGKLVQRLFMTVAELASDPSALVCVLIDEVESLSASRAGLGGDGGSRSEPGDALRVVNALLTQIDSLSRLPNVLLFATSNLTKVIDAAFLDRADLKIFVGLPNAAARMEILRSCIEELVACNLITPAASYGDASEADSSTRTGTGTGMDDDLSTNKLLWEIAQQCTEGMSGRSLRKLPLIAHATCRRQSPFAVAGDPTWPSLASFLESLKLAAAAKRL